MNLFLGAVVALQTWKNLINYHEKTYHWEENDYRLWFVIIMFSIAIVIPGWIFWVDSTINLTIFFVTMYCFIRIHTKLNKLDPLVTHEFDIHNTRKIKSYIFVFNCQLVRILETKRKKNFF
jgi:hypothetical protein